MADYYSDSEGPDAMTRQAMQSNSSKADETPVGENQPTGLLPKSILAGKDFQPGEEIVLKIVRIMDDQVEVSYAPEKESKDEGPGESPSEGSGEEMPVGDSQMRSYME